MRITQETDYAFRIIERLSEENGEVVESSKLSSELEIPQRFTLKILRKLNLVGITKATRGVNGGYYLNMKPENITYKIVIEAIEGKIYINKCLCSAKNCNRNHTEECKIHKNLVKIQNVIEEELVRYNFGVEK